jgi:hypothetical protein
MFALLVSLLPFHRSPRAMGGQQKSVELDAHLSHTDCVSGLGGKCRLSCDERLAGLGRPRDNTK